jgi:chemotaxis methyl-accepting protein methylase
MASRGTPPLDPFIQAAHKSHGLDLSPFDETFLAKALQGRLTATSAGTWALYLDRLAGDRAEAEALLQSLNIGYSEFFRNPLTFALLEQLVLPAIVAGKENAGPGEIRIWSAGCAAGQEAYSIAILLEDLAAARQRPLPFRIIATDISGTALAAARKGIYEDTAVQNVRLKHVRDCFVAQGNHYALAPRLRSRVDFSAYDLLNERSACPPASLYGDFDLILCCNLLFYYRDDVRRRVLDKICRALCPGGFFVTGEAERELALKHERFRAICTPGAVFRKWESNPE